MIDMLLEHTKSTGSVGAHWPPRHDERNKRIKGFANFLIDSEAGLSRLARVTEQSRESARDSTRTTVRAFVSSEMVQSLLEGRSACSTLSIEARIPVHNAFEGYELVYFAQNSDARTQAPSVLKTELDAVRMINGISSEEPSGVFSRLERGGYSISVLRHATERHIQTLQELYREAYVDYTFELSPQTIRDMVSNPENMFIVATDRDGNIVSAMAAERAVVEVRGADAILYELSDYATFRSHRGNGLMTAMQVFAADQLRRQPGGDMAIIFAEDRAAWTPVGISSKKAGMEYGGTLNQHCRLVADRDIGAEGNLEDLNVYFVPPFAGRLPSFAHAHEERMLAAAI
jgi:hypothetical protein